MIHAGMQHMYHMTVYTDHVRFTRTCMLGWGIYLFPIPQSLPHGIVALRNIPEDEMITNIAGSDEEGGREEDKGKMKGECIYLATAHIMAQVCSAALMVLPPGVLEERAGHEYSTVHGCLHKRKWVGLLNTRALSSLHDNDALCSSCIQVNVIHPCPGPTYQLQLSSSLYHLCCYLGS